MRCAVFSCDVCGNVTMLFGREQVGEYMPQADGDSGELEPLGSCSLVRSVPASTLDGWNPGDDDEDVDTVCEGQVMFRGYVYVAEPVKS